MVEGGFDAEAYLEQVRLLLREAKVALGGKPKGYRATNALAFAREADALTDDPANRDDRPKRDRNPRRRRLDDRAER